VRLPLALAAPAIASDDRRGGVQFRASLEAKSGGGAGSPQRVLIVDDNVDAADSLAGLLKSQGHEVRVVYRGEDGLDEYAVFAPNVIFMDINMPGMDGLQAIAKIRATAQGPRPLICTLSGHGKTYASRAFEAGADTHLVKPVSSEDLGSVFAQA
jgi:CheY-like chemotaxis protein